MSPIETVYLIASAEGVDAVLDVTDVLTGAGFVAPTPDECGSMSAMCEALIDADAVVTVDGWESSAGAHVEVSLASALGKPVLNLADLI